MIATAEYTTTRRIIPAACPVCGKSEFNAPQHKANHIAKCQRKAQAADEAEMVPMRYQEWVQTDDERRVADLYARHVAAVAANASRPRVAQREEI